MGTKNCIVKNVDPNDLAAIQTAISNNNGTDHSGWSTEVVADFPTDSDGLAFESDISGIGAGYSIASWDLHPTLLRDMKTSGFTG